MSDVVVDVRQDINRLCSDLGVEHHIQTREMVTVERYLLSIHGEISEILLRSLTDRGWEFDEYGNVFVLDIPRL